MPCTESKCPNCYDWAKNELYGIVTSDRMEGRIGSRSTQEPVDRASSTAFSSNKLNLSTGTSRYSLLVGGRAIQMQLVHFRNQARYANFTPAYGCDLFQLFKKIWIYYIIFVPIFASRAEPRSQL
jgi:hypothetical protein